MLDVEEVKETIKENGWVKSRPFAEQGCCLIGAIYLVDNPDSSLEKELEKIEKTNDTEYVYDHMIKNYDDDPVVIKLLERTWGKYREGIQPSSIYHINDSCDDMEELFGKLDEANAEV